MLISVKLRTKYVVIIYALGSVHEKFGVWIKALPNSRSKGEIPGRARRKERLSRSKLKQAFLTDSDAELFMYLIQCIRFGSWKGRRLNRALFKLFHFFKKHCCKSSVFLKVILGDLCSSVDSYYCKTKRQILFFSFSTHYWIEVSLFQASDSWRSRLRRLARKVFRVGRGFQDTFDLLSGAFVNFCFTALFLLSDSLQQAKWS